MLKEKILKEIKNFWNDEEAQGMMEYILMAIAVVGIAIALKGPLTNMVTGQTDQLQSELDNFNSGDL